MSIERDGMNIQHKANYAIYNRIAFLLLKIVAGSSNKAYLFLRKGRDNP